MSKNHGVIIVPWTANRPDWSETIQFWLMRYIAGPQEVLNKWAFPGGGIEKGETPAEAARREFTEETGLKLPAERFIPFGPSSLHARERGNPRIESHGLTYEMEYFMVRLSRIETPQCTEPEKHSAWQLFNILTMPRPICSSGEVALGRWLTWGELRWDER